MSVDRRKFLRDSLLVGATSLVCPSSATASFDAIPASENWMGVITDVSQCIGCRRCEWACNNEPSNDFQQTYALSHYEDQTIFQKHRRHSEKSLTVVNKFSQSGWENPVYVKSQCLHCIDPACLSACLVTAFSKEENGAVRYDAWRCMGCRYCLVACPFEVPSYEYWEPLTPRVRKCTLCFRERTSQGKIPACVEICPVQCMTFGKRSELLTLAREKIANNPDYVDHIYGEHEMGGTGWLYVSKVPFEQLGFLKLPSEAAPRFVEGVQHSIFRYFVGPIVLYGVLGAYMWNFRNTHADQGSKGEIDHE